jgi:hypothetical protein
MPSEKLGKGDLAIYDNRNRIKAVKSRKYAGGQDLVTKVYPTDVIPDQPRKGPPTNRPNNFMSAIHDYQTSKLMMKG